MLRTFFTVLNLFVLFLFLGEPGTFGGFSIRADDSVTILHRVALRGADDKLSIQNRENVLYGHIESLGKTEIILRSEKDRLHFPVDSVIAVGFDQEPMELTMAMMLFRTSRYKEAISQLANISNSERANLKASIRDEIEALTVRAAAEEALLKNSSLSQMEKYKRAKNLVLFIDSHPENWHYFAFCFLTGSVFQAANAPTKALDWFDRATMAPGQEAKLNALLQKGKILLQLQKSKEAEKILAPILKIDIDKTRRDPIIDVLLVHAQMTYFDALANQKKFGESIDGYRKLTQFTNLVKEKVCAEIYNGLGRVLEQAGKLNEATHAFLHVDLLYSGSEEEHTEALRRLADLWRRLQRTDRALETEKVLRDRYGIDRSISDESTKSKD